VKEEDVKIENKEFKGESLCSFYYLLKSFLVFVFQFLDQTALQDLNI